MEKYEGWTNKPTWAIMLEINNPATMQGVARRVAERAKTYAPKCRQVQEGVWDIDEAELFILADDLEELFTDDAPDTVHGADAYSTIFTWALAQVNWRELAEHLLANMDND